LYLPQFQRDFEWDEEDIRLFFDSIIRNLPVGSIILWKPIKEIEDDPFAIPLIDTNKAGLPAKSFYILDGQQRLTSLLLLYGGWKISRGGETVSRNMISYVPARNKLIVGEREGVDLSRLFRGYLDGEFRKVVEPYPRYEEILERIVRRIVDYEIPVYVIETLTESESVLREMAEAFVRINKAGMRIGTVELTLSFLAGVVHGEFSKGIRKLHKSVEDFNLDLNILIRFVLSNFGIKQTVLSNVEQFKSILDNIRFDEDILNRSEKSIQLVREFLREEFGIDDCRIIPSKVSLIPIAKYFYVKQLASVGALSSEDRKAIMNWLVVVNMRGYYSASLNTKLQEDLEVIEKNPHNFPYDRLMSKLGERSKIKYSDVEKGNSVNVLKKHGLQYLFLLYVLLMKEDAEDLDGSLLRARKYSELDKHHIFPREILLSNDVVPDDPDEREAFINGLGNITFISKSLHERIPKQFPDAEPIQYLPQFSTLQRHFIPPQKELWKLEKYEEFKQARIKAIYDAAKKHFPQIVE
jgi:hypothetical protein